jgi:hypothetical protein
MDKLSDSRITIEPDPLKRGYSITFFISDLDIMNGPVGAMAPIDEAIERFRQEVCTILNITEEQ